MKLARAGARTRKRSVFHIKSYGTTQDGRIFRTARGRIIRDSASGVVWTEAKAEGPRPRPPAAPGTASRSC